MGRTPVAMISRTETFSAAHRLHSDCLSEEENRRVFGKCNGVHGHNYTVIVTLKGTVDPGTGMVMNITDLKTAMQKAIIDQLDHKNLDVDVPGLRGTITTAENIAVFIWKEMRSVLPNPELLHKVQLHETDKNVVTYRGEYI